MVRTPVSSLAAVHIIAEVQGDIKEIRDSF